MHKQYWEEYAKDNQASLLEVSRRPQESQKMNVIEIIMQDDSINYLLGLIGKIRAGQIVGVTVVTTDTNGIVSMDTVSLPVLPSCAQSA